MIAIGIDIGVTGALAAVDSRGSATVFDLPTITIPGERMVRRRLDPCGLMSVIRQVVPAGETAIAVVENVHSMPTDSGPSGFSLGESRGFVIAVLEIARLKPRVIEPTTWKRFYDLRLPDKNGSLAREKAVALYPGMAAALARVKDHNRADSLLIAHWALRNNE